MGNLLLYIALIPALAALTFGARIVVKILVWIVAAVLLLVELVVTLCIMAARKIRGGTG